MSFVSLVMTSENSNNLSLEQLFSNIIKSTQLERLAEADEHEVVQEVQEYFADYLACGSSLVTFGLQGCVDSRPVEMHACPPTRTPAPPAGCMPVQGRVSVQSVNVPLSNGACAFAFAFCADGIP